MANLLHAPADTGIWVEWWSQEGAAGTWGTLMGPAQHTATVGALGCTVWCCCTRVCGQQPAPPAVPRRRCRLRTCEDEGPGAGQRGGPLRLTCDSGALSTGRHPAEQGECQAHRTALLPTACMAPGEGRCLPKPGSRPGQVWLVGRARPHGVGRSPETARGWAPAPFARDRDEDQKTTVVV